uniref:Uncharacterized protein n=1 Tax=Rhizophora mucronata TaxID=61149 RepID=A0A2P2PHK0_RHIMU
MAVRMAVDVEEAVWLVQMSNYSL